VGKASYASNTVSDEITNGWVTNRDIDAGTNAGHQSCKYHQSFDAAQWHHGVPENEPHVTHHPDRTPAISLSKRSKEKGTQGKTEKGNKHNNLRYSSISANVPLDIAQSRSYHAGRHVGYKLA